MDYSAGWLLKYGRQRWVELYGRETLNFVRKRSIPVSDQIQSTVPARSPEQCLEQEGTEGLPWEVNWEPKGSYPGRIVSLGTGPEKALLYRVENGFQLGLFSFH